MLDFQNAKYANMKKAVEELERIKASWRPCQPPKEPEGDASGGSGDAEATAQDPPEKKWEEHEREFQAKIDEVKTMTLAQFPPFEMRYHSADGAWTEYLKHSVTWNLARQHESALRNQ